MKDIVEKGVYATLGFWLLLHEKADEVIKELIDKGKMAPEEGRKFLDELSVKIDSEKESLKGSISSFSKKSLRELGLVTRDEYETLSKRVAALEKTKNLKKSSPKSK